MATWTPADLDAIGAARELEIASLREDGTSRDPVTIWVVRVGDELYVRSVRGEHGAWYRGAEQTHKGRVEAGGVATEVEFVDVGETSGDEIDAAYREKYGYPSGPVDSVTGAEARATTIRLEPR